MIKSSAFEFSFTVYRPADKCRFGVSANRRNFCSNPGIGYSNQCSHFSRQPTSDSHFLGQLNLHWWW